MRSKPAPLSSAARAFATSRPSVGIRSAWSRTPRSAPMASVVRIVSWAAAGPSAITTTSPAPAFSFRRSASSTANSSYGLRMNLTPASSSDLPSAAIFTRVSESGTRLMQTAIFMRKVSGIGCQETNLPSVIWQPLEDLLLEVCIHAHLHMARQARREPTLDRRAWRRGILCEGAEVEEAPVEHVPHRTAQLQVTPGERERQIGDGIVGQSARDVRLVAPQPLPPDVAGVHPGKERYTGPGRPGMEDRHRQPGVHTVPRHHRELVSRRHGLTGRVAGGGERRRGLERGARVAA